MTNLRGLNLFGGEKSQNGASRSFCSGEEMGDPNHSDRPRIRCASKQMRKRVPKRMLPTLADVTVFVSVRPIPAAATAISAKSIIHPRIFSSSEYNDSC